MTQRALLCPRCRRLIGSDETVCSWCGTTRKAAWWTAAAWTRGFFDGDMTVKAIITVTIVFYAISLFIAGRHAMSGGLLSFLSPSDTSLFMLGDTGTIPIDRYGRYWTLISATYLHGGILHLIFNMSALNRIGPWVNNEYGVSRMFSIYTIGGVCGFVVSYIAGVPSTIGASASICALIGALLYYGKSRGGAYGAAVYSEVSGWVVGLVLFGLIFPGINNWGHGGGIAGGIFLGWLLGYRERRPESSVDRLLAGICAVVTMAVLGWALLSTGLIILRS